MPTSSPQAVHYALTGPLKVQLAASDDEVDEESTDDFYSAFIDLEQQCEQVVITLENHPNSTEHMQTLFGLFHQLKSDFI